MGIFRTFSAAELEALGRLRALGLSHKRIAARMGRPESSVRVKLAELAALEDDEPTEDELEATIAQQRANLPAWWDEPDPTEGA